MDTILLIESNVIILENFTEYFEMEGFKILSACDGNKNAATAMEFKLDLIISDIQMHEIIDSPGLRQVVRGRRASAIPFIFTTTNSEKFDKLLALEFGADDYIIKPFSMELLSEMARKWIKSGTKRHG